MNRYDDDYRIMLRAVKDIVTIILTTLGIIYLFFCGDMHSIITPIILILTAIGFRYSIIAFFDVLHIIEQHIWISLIVLIITLFMLKMFSIALDM